MEKTEASLREFIKGLRWESGLFFRKGKEYSRGTMAVVLFATAFLTTLAVTAGWVVAILSSSPDDQRLLFSVFTASALLPFVTWIPIASLYVRSGNLVWFTVFPAAILGSGLALYYVYFVMGIQPDPPFMEHFDSITNLLPFMIAVLFSMSMTVNSKMRASYLFSEKTNSWLHSHILKKSFTPPGDITADNLTLDDVLRFEPAKRKSDFCRIALYLDRIATGDHILVVVFRPRNGPQSTGMKPLIVKLSQAMGPPIVKLISVNRSEVEQVARRFGPFKRTLFNRPPHLLL